MIKQKSIFTADNIVCFAFLSVFLHYSVTAVTIAAIGVSILIKSETRREIFAKKSHLILVAFCVITMLVAAFYKNYIGIVCPIALYFVMLIFYWARSVMTRDLFEKGINLCCTLAMPLALAVGIERIININDNLYRCQLWFFNANYMTAIFAGVALFCVSKIIEDFKQTFYIISFSTCILAMYLSGSMFAFVELFIGICFLLILRKKYLLFAGFFFLAFLGLVILYFFPEIFPRILVASRQTDKRVEIWEWSISLIKERPLFGQGFLTLYHNAKQNTVVDAKDFVHAHNFLLEPLTSFGIIGTILIVILLVICFKRLLKCKEKFADDKIITLVLSLFGAVLVHSTTDMTMMWIQTGLLYGLVLATVGIGERELQNLDKTTPE